MFQKSIFSLPGPYMHTIKIPIHLIVKVNKTLFNTNLNLLGNYNIVIT